MTALQPGDQLDHYILDDFVARGGMATVFRGRDMVTGAAVAIKVPHPEAECDPVMFDRFRRETQIGEQIDHPGVVKVMRESRRSRPYMAAEWVDGISLRSILSGGKTLPVERALRLTIAISKALEHIHARGIVHRDLKPENIMVRADDSVTLIDFGLASLAGARRLTFGKFSRIMGTADYISPEQVQGKRGDARSDIYALGVVLYEMLAGKTPWEGKNPFAVMKERTVNDPVSLRSVNGDVPEPVEAIVRRAMQRNPAARFADAAEFARALADPEGFAAESREAPGTRREQPRPTPWWLSVIVIPLSVLLMLLYAVSRQ